MKDEFIFKLRPIVIGENHNDPVPKQFLIDNLDKLREQGYECFAYEWDHDKTLDEVIGSMEPWLEDVDIEEFKRKRLLDVIKAHHLLHIVGITYSESQLEALPTEGLFKITDATTLGLIVREEITSGIQQLSLKQQLAPERKEAFRAYIDLFKKVKALNFKYIGLDYPLGKDRSPTQIFSSSAPLSKYAEQRGDEITKRLAVNAKIYSGGVIGLVGLAHFVDIVKKLPERFESPLFKMLPKEENLQKFLFIRPYGKEFETPELQSNISVIYKQLAQQYPWFDFKQYLIEARGQIAVESILTDAYCGVSSHNP